MFSHTNIEAPSTEPKTTKASFNIKQPRGESKETLFILALSGGGSRAAYWSGSIMLALETVFQHQGFNLLQEVDAISSVSGGSLPAAYYAISYSQTDPSGSAPSNRLWNESTVKDLMTRNYRARWVGNWFWPVNSVKYWFTDFDRSDMMAQTFADNMFDVGMAGFDLKFSDINPNRPNLILNATNGTEGQFGELFTFTDEHFRRLHSDISDYDIARAVMATASFPAAFNYMTLKNYTGENHYIHLFDGGNYDNLGLESTKLILEKNKSNFKNFIVILIDAYIDSPGVSIRKKDAREFLDYAVDLNFIDSFDSLLALNRNNSIENFKSALKQFEPTRSVFYHIQFDDIDDLELREKLGTIATDFNIKKDAIVAIDDAVTELIRKDNACLQIIKAMMFEKGINDQSQYCQWTY